MQAIALQNNIGVMLMRSRNVVNAAQVFSDTLRSFQQLAGNHPESFTSISNPTQTSASNSLDEGMLVADVDLLNSDGNDDFFLYDRGVAVPDGMKDPRMVSAILIFNSAISHHLCAKLYPPNSTQYLLRARSLYTLAYQMQEAPASSHNALFRVAIINNSALVERSLGNELGCRMFFDCLMSMWALPVVQEHGLRLRNMRNFLWNIFGRKQDTAAAA